MLHNSDITRYLTDIWLRSPNLNITWLLYNYVHNFSRLPEPEISNSYTFYEAKENKDCVWALFGYCTSVKKKRVIWMYFPCLLLISWVDSDKCSSWNKLGFAVRISQIFTCKLVWTLYKFRTCRMHIYFETSSLLDFLALPFSPLLRRILVVITERLLGIERFTDGLIWQRPLKSSRVECPLT